MNDEGPGLRAFLRIVRRHKVIVGTLVLLGLLGGVMYTVVKPPMVSSKTLVVLPPSIHDIATQAMIAESVPVLARALHNADAQMSLQALSDRVQATPVTSNMLSVAAEGGTAAEAERTANAVTASYLAYVGSGNAPGGRVVASVLEPATTATGTSVLARLAETGLLGAVLGALIGIVVAFAVGRGSRRLRERDDIADSIGVPVLASIPVARPANAASWTKLFEGYEAEPVGAWHMRKALHLLGLADIRGSTGASLTILTLASDRKALALGPQLAVFAATIGIPTVLVVGPQQDRNVTATLRAACAAPSPSPRGPGRGANLQLAVTDHEQPVPLQTAALTVVVAVVNAQDPQLADGIHTASTVLGVSAGGATAEQLARVAASAAAEGRYLAGILVADPEPSDHTTGRLPQLMRPAQPRMPTRMNSTAMGNRP